MKAVHRVMTALVLSALLYPATASARQVAERPRQSPFDFPIGTIDSAAQGPSLQPQSPPGGKLLRNVVIGAGVGAGVMAVLGRGFGDCGNCSADQAKAIASGAMYGALIGAAIRIRPALRPHPSSRQPPRKAALSPQVSKRVKAMNVVMHF